MQPLKGVHSNTFHSEMVTIRSPLDPCSSGGMFRSASGISLDVLAARRYRLARDRIVSHLCLRPPLLDLNAMFNFDIGAVRGKGYWYSLQRAKKNVYSHLQGVEFV